MVNTFSTTIAPPIKKPDLQANDRHGGNERIAQRMPQDDPAFFDAFGPRGGDIV